MDRFNWPCNNTNHYYDHYYNQAHQEDDQHTFQPETGQTSAGGSASGAWGSHPAGSYPAPGQPQPYLNPNLSVQIPPSPVPNWEYFLRTPQPMELEDIIPSQRHQEDSQHTFGQHTFAPQTGQTSAGGSASGAWESHPAANYPEPGQPQPYQDLNPPAPILSWPRPDWGTSQPITVADLSQNDALPESSNPQSAAPARHCKPRVRGLPPVKERFLAGLDNYAQGVALKDCSATLPFRKYAADNGRLRAAGIDVYSGLSSREQERVNEALLSRREFYLKRAMDNPPVEERFLAGLKNYARGVRLADCSATLQFHRYVTNNGLLLTPGEALYKSLPAEDQAQVNEALLCRSERNSKQAKKNTKDMPPIEERFLASLDNYAQGLSLNECSEDIQLRTYLTDDGRFRLSRGQPLYNRLSRDDKERVDKALTARGKIYAQHIARDVAKFMAMLEPYSNGLSLQECGIKSGLKAKASVYFTPEGGLRPKGQR
ncbi:MAG: hypothetical protein P8X89_23690, partial [Reinekea sp.]